MFIEYAEFMQQPEAAVREVLRFVGADPALARPLPAPAAPPQGDEGHGRRMHPAVRRKLLNYYAGPNQRLFALLGRDFTWGEGGPAADEEEGGAGGASFIDDVTAAAQALHRSIMALRTKKPVDKSRAAELMPAQGLARKESGLVKRVVSVSARV